MATHKASVVIPCHFVDKSFVTMTEKCLESLNYDYPDEVIVVNDGSPYNKGLDYIKQLADKYISYKDNHGFPYAVNKGIEASRNDFIVILNNDTECTPKWLTELLRPLHGGYDISSIRTSDTDGWLTEKKVTENDNFGSCWAMKRRVYNRLGGLDEQFGKGTFEDQDYKQRALEAGFTIAKNHNGLVEHIGRATFAKVDPQNKTFLENRKKYRAKWGRVD